MQAHWLYDSNLRPTTTFLTLWTPWNRCSSSSSSFAEWQVWDLVGLEAEG